MNNKFLNEKYFLSFVPTLFLTIFFLIPVIIMLVVAFRIPGDYGALSPIIVNNHAKLQFNLTGENFNYVFNNWLIWKLFFRSVVYSLITTIICLILGYPLALLIAKANKKIQNTLLLLIIIPFWSNFLIRIYAWMIILGPQASLTRMINRLLNFFGYDSVNLIYSSFAVILCLVYINLPFMVLPLYANLEKHDNSLVEVSRDLGATKIKSLWQITIPLSAGGIFSGSALVFIPCMGMFVVPDLVGNNCSMMIGNLIKQQFLEIMNWPMGSVSSILMTVTVSLIVALIGIIFLKKLNYANHKTI